MRGKIILIGTSHPIQCGSTACAPEAVQNFRTFLHKSCRSHGIRFVAEEMSPNGLSYHGVTASIAQLLAEEQSIPYLAVDLDVNERKELGIDDWSLGKASAPPGTHVSDSILWDVLREKISNPLRECCWFARILAKDIWPTLFICGADHVQNMVSLMHSVGQDVIVEHTDYDP